MGWMGFNATLLGTAHDREIRGQARKRGVTNEDRHDSLVAMNTDTISSTAIIQTTSSSATLAL